MDTRLLDAIAKNDKQAFVSLVHENEGMIEQRIGNSLNTVLHLASRFGHTELVTEIVKLQPEMIAAENIRLETPLHEACWRGNASVVMVLLNTSPWVACKLNSENKSPFFLACSQGHLNVVKLLLNQPWLLGLEEDGFDQNCLNIAVSKGHTGIVRKILDVCPNYAQKIDENGYTSLHIASSKGHLEITKMLLRLDTDVAVQFNNDGYTPFHLAAMNGCVAILKEFMSMAPTCFQYFTRQGETVFHLVVRHGHYDAFLYLVQVLYDTDIFHSRDKYGNTILHIAASAGNYEIVKHLIHKTTLDVNAQNNKGFTVLDILDQKKENSENLHLDLLLLRDEKESAIKDDDINEPESSSDKKGSPPTRIQRQKRLSERRWERLSGLHNYQQDKQHESHREALLNARNTIIIIAVLIATVTFAAGICPPGGVYQDDGRLKGKSIAVAGRTIAFKVFILSNSVALFTSLCTVAVLVSIIPFQRKPQMRLLVIAHKFMWAALLFMATAYIAAIWVIMPQSHGTEWVTLVVLSAGSGTLGITFIGLTVLMVEHWQRKLKWRRDRNRRREDLAHLRASRIQSFNSDVESSNRLGYHSY